MPRTTPLPFVATLLAACSSAGGTAPANSIRLSAPRADLVPGETIQLLYEVKDPAGHVQFAPSVTFSSSNAAVATVGFQGTVTATKAGTATITATGGTSRAQVKFTVLEGGLATPGGLTIRAYDGAVELVVPAGAVTSTSAV